MVVGAYHTATGRFNTKTNESPHPADEQLEKFTSKDPARLLQQADWTIREKDRFPAAAVIQRYSQLGQAARPVFDLMPGYATARTELCTRKNTIALYLKSAVRRLKHSGGGIGPRDSQPSWKSFSGLCRSLWTAERLHITDSILCREHAGTQHTAVQFILMIQTFLTSILPGSRRTKCFISRTVTVDRTRDMSSCVVLRTSSTDTGDVLIRFRISRSCGLRLSSRGS